MSHDLTASTVTGSGKPAVIAENEKISEATVARGYTLAGIIMPDNLPSKQAIYFQVNNPGTEDFYPLRGNDGKRISIIGEPSSVLALEKYWFSYAEKVKLELADGNTAVELAFKFILSLEG